MLWAMKIERPRDSNGVPVPIDLDSSVRSGLVVCVYLYHRYPFSKCLLYIAHRIPTPFDIKVTPRFPDAVTILERERDALEKS